MTDRNINYSGREVDQNQAMRPALNYVLWAVQVLLALIFLFAGGAKLVMSAEAMKGPVEIPVLFLRFIGVCEILGALGLILPGVFRIRRELTPLAASGLVIVMIGATVVNLVSGLTGVALFTAVVGGLAAFVAYQRKPSKQRPSVGSRRSTTPTTPISGSIS